jgi:hypothetical protein
MCVGVGVGGWVWVGVFEDRATCPCACRHSQHVTSEPTTTAQQAAASGGGAKEEGGRGRKRRKSAEGGATEAAAAEEGAEGDGLDPLEATFLPRAVDEFVALAEALPQPGDEVGGWVGGALGLGCVCVWVDVCAGLLGLGGALVRLLRSQFTHRRVAACVLNAW